jgi:hypothetical protein
MIQFPKILVFELVEYPCEYPKYYIRIYEKRHLDTKLQSRNVYLYLRGEYVLKREEEEGEEGAGGRSMKGEFNEKVSQVDAFFGSKANYVLSQFVKRVLEGYMNRNGETMIRIEKQKGESISSSALWSELEESIGLNEGAGGPDKWWPCEAEEAEAESYPYPYQIDPHEWSESNPLSASAKDWVPKKEEEVNETFDDNENVKYRIKNEFDIKIKKQEVEFDPNRIQLFRVSLTPNEQKLQQYMIQLKTQFTPD